MPRVKFYPFNYTEIPIGPCPAFPDGRKLYRPALTAKVASPSGACSELCIVGVDSGADYCTFPESLAARIGIDLSNAPTTPGLLSTRDSINQFAEVQITIPLDDKTPALSFSVLGCFSKAMDDCDTAVLGNCGFFDTFRVLFDHRARYFYIEAPEG
jgi:hypothetical protein